jgi:hypothetical protein
MRDVRSFCLLLAGACVVTTGCSVADGDVPYDGDAFDVPFETLDDPPPGGSNGDLAKCMHNTDVHTMLEKMSLAKLDYDDGALENPPSYLGDCSHIVKSAIQCALDTSQSVTDPVTGEVLEGHWGLATGWRANPLSVTGQRWVTACMLQKLNGYGWTVPILLEGANTPINVQPALDPSYPFDESTAFGNYFLPEPMLYVCRESDLIAQCEGQPLLADLDLYSRICDSNSNSCGLQVIGNCSTACQQNGAYWKCQPPGGVMYTETIRVQLQTYAGEHCPTL